MEIRVWSAKFSLLWCEVFDVMRVFLVGPRLFAEDCQGTGSIRDCARKRPETRPMGIVGNPIGYMPRLVKIRAK